MSIIDDLKKAGATDELTNREYHEQTWAVSSSYLKRMFEKGQKAADTPWKPSAALQARLDVGTAVHAALLEDKALDECGFAIKPEGLSLATKAGKEWKAEVVEAGLTVMAAENARVVTEAVNAAASYFPIGLDLDEANIRERSLFWLDVASNVWCRARPDAFGGDVLLDVKTTTRFDDFEREIFGRGYDLQAAFYREVIIATGQLEKVERVGFIAVEVEEPFRVGAFYLQPEDVDLAWDVCKRLLHRIDESRTVQGYKASDVYCGNKVETVTCPAWEYDRRAVFFTN